MNTERVLTRLSNEVRRGPRDIVVSHDEAAAILKKVDMLETITARLLERLKGADLSFLLTKPAGG